MAKFTRAQILERLHGTLASGQPIVAAAAGVGIVAKCAEHAGVDLIVVLCTSKARWLGVPTSWPLGNANQTTLGMYRQVHNVVDNTPIVGGAESTDATFRRLPELLQAFQDTGFDGITNFPTPGVSAGWGMARIAVGQGVDRDFQLMRMAREQGYFSMGMALSAEHARGLAEAGADVVVARCGLTRGGLVGPEESQMGFEQAAAHVQEIVEAARSQGPDVICLAQGGPFARPDDTDYLYEHTDAQGFLGESAIERIPVEEYVAAEVRAMKETRLRSSTAG